MPTSLKLLQEFLEENIKELKTEYLEQCNELNNVRVKIHPGKILELINKIEFDILKLKEHINE